MAEPSKIVLILGNGFDLDLGLKTSYKDFWESEFCPKDYPAPLIQHLNEHWKEDIESVRWYDLENELHAYATIEEKTDIIDEKQRSYIRSHFDYELTLASTYTGVDDVFTSLVQTGIIRIAGVLRSAYVPYRDDLLESASWRDRKAVGLIKEGLCKYLKSISGQSTGNHSIALSVLLAANCARESGDFLNIYTFNYTPLPVDHGNGFQNIVHHVHGNCAVRIEPEKYHSRVILSCVYLHLQALESFLQWYKTDFGAVIVNADDMISELKRVSRILLSHFLDVYEYQPDVFVKN